jgi:hypothetical protein
VSVELHAQAIVPLYALITDSISDRVASIFNAKTVTTFHKERISCKKELVNVSYLRICAASRV